MIWRLFLALFLLPTPALARDPWEVERVDMDVATRDAVDAVEACLRVETRAVPGDFGHCIDYAYASCREWEKPKGFRARTCLEQAHHTWRWMVWSLTKRLPDVVDDPSLAALADERWQAYMETFCAFGASTVHPWSDDPGDRSDACRTELAARHAISLWVTQTP